MISPKAISRDERATASIEFAFVSIFMFGIIVVALDFGMYVQQKLKLGNAVEQGAVLAFNNRSASTVNTTSIATYVSSTVGGSLATTFQCNGATCSSAQTMQCIVAPANSSAWPTFVAPTGSGGTSTCTGGASPGYYLVVRASKTYQSIAVPDKYLGGSLMTQQVVVRLA